MFGPMPDGGNLDGGVSGGSGVSWWQDTLGFVIKAAAVKEFAPVQKNQQYYVDAYGRVLPAGASVIGQQVAAPQNQLTTLVLLGIGAMLIFKLAQ